jgi:peptidoglycan/xylan/chitin deacetylase (PgdA/CDA1 family)
MRLDRFLTVNVFHRFRKTRTSRPVPPGGDNDSDRIPILMYHSISADPESGVGAYFRTVTTPERFADQMRFLRDKGWRGLSLCEGLDMKEGRGPGKFFVLTFDDGFRDFLTTAMPVLRTYGFGATVFLPTAYNSDSDVPRRFLGRECLTWSEVRSLHAEGIEFGSHTVSHPKLVSLPWAQVASEVGDSKVEIEQKLGRPVLSFSYPFAFPQGNGAFCARLRGLLAEKGYGACVTTEIGSSLKARDLLRLPRLPVNDCDDLPLLEAKLDGAYDWLSIPQTAFKSLRSFPASLRLKPQVPS